LAFSPYSADLSFSPIGINTLSDIYNSNTILNAILKVKNSFIIDNFGSCHIYDLINKNLTTNLIKFKDNRYGAHNCVGKIEF
jgi:hypothetical protein